MSTIQVVFFVYFIGGGGEVVVDFVAQEVAGVGGKHGECGVALFGVVLGGHIAGRHDQSVEEDEGVFAGVSADAFLAFCGVEFEVFGESAIVIEVGDCFDDAERAGAIELSAQVDVGCDVVFEAHDLEGGFAGFVIGDGRLGHWFIWGGRVGLGFVLGADVVPVE